MTPLESHALAFVIGAACAFLVDYALSRRGWFK